MNQHEIYWILVVTLLSVCSGIHKDELQTAIELSLRQESHNAQEEERELNRYDGTVAMQKL